VQRNEYTVWVASDKHANTYQVLLSAQSQRIAKSLGITAHEDIRCLACHTNPLTAFQESSSSLKEERLFHGIGCESCHGPAQSWLASHTKRDEWQKKNSSQKESLGMKPVDDPVALARTCAGCHVGAPPASNQGLPVRDVNHDLIAAEHPRLNFELTVYLANMPRHWSERTEENRQASVASTWAAGQAVSAHAALDLLAYRAQNLDRPWPEFAEYDCFACHHDLQEPSWRQTRERGKRSVGSLSWGSWYFSMLGWSERPASDSALENLRDIMEKPFPDRQKVWQQVPAAHAQIENSLTKWQEAVKRRDKLMLLVAALAEDRQHLAREGWDAAEQLALAVAAMNQSHGDKQVQPAIHQLLEGLAFPPPIGQSHPDGPQTFAPDRFQEDLARVRKLLRR
jgi:hypothetical protein